MTAGELDADSDAKPNPPDGHRAALQGPAEVHVDVPPQPVSLGPCRDEWEFHQATGMAAAQLGGHDMNEAASRLIATAAQLGQPVHDTALAVIDPRLWLDPQSPTRD